MVDPAHPPINISIRKKTKGKFPQLLKFSVVYPVPVRIDITLNETDTKLVSLKPPSFIIMYKYKIIIENITIFKKDLI